MRLVAALFILVASAQSARAADSSSGCGPGWYVLKENSLLSSTLRSTTNGILFPTYTFGMTTGTSNCAQHKVIYNDKRDLHFVAMNRELLMKEMAEGTGESLAAFAATLRCSVAVEARFGQVSQAHFEEIWSSDVVANEVVVDQVRSVVRGDALLASGCGAA